MLVHFVFLLVVKKDISDPSNDSFPKDDLDDVKVYVGFCFLILEGKSKNSMERFGKNMPLRQCRIP